MHISRKDTIARLLLIQGSCHLDASHYRSLPHITCKTSTVCKLLVQERKGQVVCTRPAFRLPKTPASTLSAETIRSYTRPCVPEDGHSGARNMLS